MNPIRFYHALFASIGLHLLIFAVFALGNLVGGLFFSKPIQQAPLFSAIELVTVSNSLSSRSLSLKQPKSVSSKPQNKLIETRKFSASPSGTIPSPLATQPAEEAKDLAMQPASDQSQIPSTTFNRDPEGEGVGASPLQIYVSQVIHKIDSLKVYPEESLFRSEEGQVVVLLQIFPDGTIKHFHLTKLCPFEALNAATLNTIAQLKSFPPLPYGRLKPLTMQVPIVYKIERNKTS